MKDKIRILFEKIYPGDVPIAKKMTYDENRKDHVVTKIAMVNGEPVGQANMFRVRNQEDVSYLGYHVHPEFRKKRIGTNLSLAVMREARKKGIKRVVIRTHPTNAASISLAKSLGFVEEKKPIKKGEISFRKDI
ncbi:hypothetical protein BVX98_05785 [bacterium F11]|nr:hypothetical protein BVX98_05785 [bacterium F11]